MSDNEKLITEALRAISALTDVSDKARLAAMRAVLHVQDRHVPASAEIVPTQPSDAWRPAANNKPPNLQPAPVVGAPAPRKPSGQTRLQRTRANAWLGSESLGMSWTTAGKSRRIPSFAFGEKLFRELGWQKGQKIEINYNGEHLIFRPGPRGNPVLSRNTTKMISMGIRLYEVPGLQEPAHNIGLTLLTYQINGDCLIAIPILA